MSYHGHHEDDIFVRTSREQINRDADTINDDATASELAQLTDGFYHGKYAGVGLAELREHVRAVRIQALAQVAAAAELGDQRDLREYGAVEQMTEYQLEVMSLDGNIPHFSRKTYNIYKSLLNES